MPGTEHPDFISTGAPSFHIDGKEEVVRPSLLATIRRFTYMLPCVLFLVPLAWLAGTAPCGGGAFFALLMLPLFGILVLQYAYAWWKFFESPQSGAFLLLLSPLLFVALVQLSL